MDEDNSRKPSYREIKCSICGGGIWLDEIMYYNYTGIITCNCSSDKHKIHVNIKNQALLDTPTPVYFIDTDFKSPPIPKNILDDLTEASICYSNNARKACVVMCGRSLEGLTIEQKAKGGSLNDKIKYLYDNNQISKPLLDAFTKVRILRNIGAHYQPLKEIPKGEGKKILDITKHVIEHVYLLPE